VVSVQKGEHVYMFGKYLASGGKWTEKNKNRKKKK